jgi:hypothetical protein
MEPLEGSIYIYNIWALPGSIKWGSFKPPRIYIVKISAFPIVVINRSLETSLANDATLRPKSFVYVLGYRKEAQINGDNL